MKRRPSGLFDDNNIEICEGDILKCSSDDYIYKYSGERKYTTFYFEVVFGNPYGMDTWGFNLCQIAGSEKAANTDILLWVETELPYFHCEIVGSVDNIEAFKEFLKDEKNE